MSSAKSVIISCAGIGSRLGLGTTKALIDIGGKSLISWQLELFKDIEDLRIVVGYQANDVIEEVKKYRKDVVFVYNHDYFNTKTGSSYYLGAKDGNKYAIGIDGDLLVHPEDMKMLLNTDGEWIAYSDKMSNDAVFCNLNNDEVVSFSRTEGDFEWTGPCCLSKDKLQYSSDSHVFNQLEPFLPLRGIKIRACDIDTYEDYGQALKILSSWNKL
ncbi:NTP transferase domain-containing protein [Campylobacter jejuni]|uniref:NTP transferase domain-containing protein n=1 Tax=Campylobacter jejuni TaxID=197 RepID=UPI0011A5A38D|nr:NTP transferase domain-containing protein [Campylobacter jejuni]